MLPSMRRQQIVGARFKANPLSPCGQSRHRPLDATVLFRAHLLDVSAGGQMVGRRFPPGAQRSVQRRLAAHCPGCVRLADVQTWQEGWTVTEHGRRPGAVRRPRPQAYLSFANDRHDSELRPKATGAPVRSRVGPSGRRRVRPPRVIRLAAATRRRRGVPYLHPAGSSLIVPGAHDLAAIQDSRRDAACRAEDLFVPRLVNDQGPVLTAEQISVERWQQRDPCGRRLDRGLRGAAGGGQPWSTEVKLLSSGALSARA